MSIAQSTPIGWVTRGEVAPFELSCGSVPLPDGVDDWTYRIGIGTDHNPTNDIITVTSGITVEDGVVSFSLTAVQTASLTADTRYSIGLWRADSGFQRLLLRDYFQVKDASGKP